MKRRRARTANNYFLWWFLIFLIWIFILVRIIPSLFKATVCWVREAKELKKIKSEKEKIERENKEKEEYINNLKQGKGWEEELRKRGFVKEGEILIEIEGKLPEPPNKKENLFQKILLWLEKRNN